MTLAAAAVAALHRSPLRSRPSRRRHRPAARVGQQEASKYRARFTRPTRQRWASVCLLARRRHPVSRRRRNELTSTITTTTTRCRLRIDRRNLLAIHRRHDEHRAGNTVHGLFSRTVFLPNPSSPGTFVHHHKLRRAEKTLASSQCVSSRMTCRSSRTRRWACPITSRCQCIRGAASAMSSALCRRTRPSMSRSSACSSTAPS